MVIAQMGNREIYSSEAFTWISFSPEVWPNYVFRFNFTEQNGKQRIEVLKQHISEGKAPNWLIVNQASNQNEWLMNNVFERKSQSTGMAINLSKMLPNLPTLGGLTVSTVTDEIALNHWTETVSAGMWRSEIDLERAAFLKLITQGEMQCYVAYLENKPVATSMLFLSAGVAGLYLVSTRPDYRKRGIGAIMTLTALHATKGLGYRMGILQATEAGKPIYQKIGFTELCKFNYYALK